MVSQAKGGCRECGSMTHTKMYHKPKKPIKRSPIKQITSYEQYKMAVQIDGATKRKPRKKSTPRAAAKNKAWDAFSMYIRTRDCLRFGGSPTDGQCVTCKNWYDIKQLQAGHFIGGRGNAVLFREDLVYSQCYHCNQKPPMGLGGNYVKYTLFMLSEGYTAEQIDDFTRLKGTTKVYKTHDFVEIQQRYKEKLAELLS